MKFEDYCKTKLIYHIVNINDLKNVLKKGIQYDDKTSYETRYLDFHRFIDKYKPSKLPSWVIREKAIFASMNFKDEHKWHSHSAILGLKIKEDYCWIANENLANETYEPFILKDNNRFDFMNEYINTIGVDNIKKYWETSLSFKDNLNIRLDKNKNFDCEVLIFHDIKPEDIAPIGIITDHRYIEYNNLRNIYLKEGNKSGDR